MLCAHTMPCSDNAALQERECAFNSIRVNVSVNVDFALVADRAMFAAMHPSLDHCGNVCLKFIRHDHVNIPGAHILSDVLRQRAALGVLRVEETQLSATLADADHDFLVSGMRPLSVAFMLSADVGLINLYGAGKRLLRGNGCHRLANPMAEIPSRFVTDSHHAMNLVRAHPLARFAKQICNSEPLVQGEMRVMKDRSSGHGELIAA